MLPSGLPEVVADDEPLARFLMSSSQFNALMVKPAAYMPSAKDGNTSVFRHGAEPRESLLEIAGTHVVGERTLHGVAICTAQQVRASELNVVAQEPPPRHANITGWPVVANDPEQTKAQQKERALLIAQHAVLVRVPR
jgi:hypothetical protein